MKLNQTSGAAPIGQYQQYVHNCLRNVACEPGWAAPLPDVSHLEVYADLGPYKPLTMQVWLQDMCDTSHTEQIMPSNYLVGRTPEGGWYGVFKYFTHPVVPVTGFVVWLSVEVDAPGGPREVTFFSELLTVEPCGPLTKIKACQPQQATTTGFDLNGVYYGLPVNDDFLGYAGVRYFHIAYTRRTKVRELAPKATFTSNLIRNFRTIIDRSWILEPEFVPQWFKDLLLAIYARGAITINDVKSYLVSDVNMDPLNDDDVTWKPFCTLKLTSRLYFGCDDSTCFECCSPQVLRAISSTLGFVNCDESPVTSSSAVPECCTPTILSIMQEIVSESSSAPQESSSPAPEFDADAQAFIDAVGTLTDPQQGYVDFLVRSLKSASVWTKLRAVYPLIGGTAAAHKWNLKDPRDLDAAFRLTFAGTLTHDGLGVVGDGATGYADTHLGADLSAGGHSVGYYTDTNDGNATVELGASSVVLLQVALNIAGTYHFNDGGVQTTGVIADPRGCWFGVRENATDLAYYWQGGGFNAATGAVGTGPAIPLYLLARNDGGSPNLYSTKRCSFAFVGDALDATEAMNLFNTIQAFQTALGRAV